MDNYPTNGRPMTGALQRALDAVAPEDRNAVCVALRANDGRLGPVLHAIATEIELAGLRQADADRELRALGQELLPDPPIDRSGDRPGVFDPETGRIVLAGDDTTEPPAAA